MPYGRPAVQLPGSSKRFRPWCAAPATVVVTSVARDDLADGGSRIFAETITQMRERSPGMGIEVLIPDFDGSDDRLRTVMDARPDILNHNLETVRRLQKPVRKRARWDRSLYVLRRAKEMAVEIGYAVHTKSSLMVGLGVTGPGNLAPADPVHLLAPRVLHAGQALGEIAAPQLGHLHAPDAVTVQLREVDVEQHVPGEFLDRHDPLDQAGERRLIGAQLLGDPAGERDRDPRHSERHRFHRRRDGAGVQHVLSHVGAQVHAGEDKVGLLRHEGSQSQQHAIGWGAIHLERAIMPPLGSERPMQRERVRGAALFPVRRDDRHLSHSTARLGQDRESR